MQLLLALLVSISLTYAHLIGPQPLKHFHGNQVLRVTVSNEKQFDALITLYNSEHNFDFWNGPTRSGTSDIMATPAKLQLLKNYLVEDQIPFSVMIDDVEQVVAKERAGRKLRGIMGNGVKAINWTEYHSYESIIEWVYELAAANPSLASTQVIGKTIEGRDIVLIKISTGGSGKPAFFVDGTMHAREWISPAVTTYIINELLSGNAEYDDILDTVDFYFVPVLNADGYEYTQSSDRMWRKNRRINPDGGCDGVDLNRNYDDHFGGVGSSSSPCSETYHGDAGFSEPETEAVRQFLEDNKDVNWTVYISMHSYSQLWLSPWNWTQDLVDDHDDIMEVSNAAVDAIKAVHGKTYIAGSGANVLYYSSGCSVDWAKSFGFKYSYTIELRDEGNYGFILPESEILPNSEEIWEAYKVMSRQIVRK